MDMQAQIKHVAELARLKFDEAEVAAFALDFEKIIRYIDVIGSLDISEVEPLKAVVTHENRFRDDEPHECLPLSDVLAGAPKRNESFFKVPRVIG